jgi:hypothetical protein
MKERGKFKFVLFLAVACAFLFFPVNSFSESAGDYKPTPPPAIPAADFASEGRIYLDFIGLYADIDAGEENITLKGIGGGINYVSMVKELGWNVSGSCFYLTGENDKNTGDLTGVMVPLTANIAFRPYSNPGGNSLIFFAGLHYSWTGVWIDYQEGSTLTEIDLYLTTIGPMFGAKARLMLRPGLAFIPYYVFKYENYDAEVVVNGVSRSVDIDSEGVQLFGFDIEIGAVSIGAMLDMITNSDRKMYFITFTYNLDYSESAPAAKADTAPPKAPQRGRGAK